MRPSIVYTQIVMTIGLSLLEELKNDTKRFIIYHLVVNIKPPRPGLSFTLALRLAKPYLVCVAESYCEIWNMFVNDLSEPSQIAISQIMTVPPPKNVHPGHLVLCYQLCSF